MKATPIYPFTALHGSITKDHYCRILNGKLIVQRRPNRTGHIPTPSESANQQFFASRYRVRTSTCPKGDHMATTHNASATSNL